MPKSLRANLLPFSNICMSIIFLTETLRSSELYIDHIPPFFLGTDDGITFTSANSKSVPQQPIRNITTNTHPRGSFPKKDGSDITRPFGQIKLQLMQTFGECGNPAPLPFPERRKCFVQLALVNLLI